MFIKALRRAVAAMAIAGSVLLPGCTEQIKEDIKNLQERVTALEEATETLSRQFGEGAMIKSIVPLPNDAGWRIEFTGGASRGDIDPVDILNGNDGTNGVNGVTPKIEVRTNTDGSVTIWYNDVSGYPASEWTNTGVDLAGKAGEAGPQGPQGIQGPQGPQGPQGVAGAAAHVEFRVAENHYDGDRPYIWYTTVEAVGRTEADWKPLLPAGGSGPIATVIDNDNGTVTIVMNDDTQYTFAKYSAAQHFEIIKVGFVEDGGEGEAPAFRVTFRVNPSTAFVPTDVAKWSLDLVEERATRSYVTPTAAFTLESVLPEDNVNKQGQYVATLRSGESYYPLTEYTMTLVLDNGVGDGREELVSSGVFTVAEPNSEIAIDAEHFPDVIFRNYIRAVMDRDGSGTLSTAERAKVRSITLSGKTTPALVTVMSVKGIEYFPWLTQLTCSYLPLLTEIDTTKNPRVSYLVTMETGLEKLDISNNPKLHTLVCSNNRVTELDLSHNPELGSFRSQFARLTELDVSHNPKLFNCLFNGNPGRDGLFEVKAWFDFDSVSGGSNPIQIATTTSWKYPDAAGETVNVRYVNVAQ